MSAQQAQNQFQPTPEEQCIGHIDDCGLCLNWRDFQAMFISTSTQKRGKAVERIMVIEGVV